MTVLITGVNGFIGRHLSRELQRREIQIRGTARSSNHSNIKDFVECDLEQVLSLDKLVMGCDTIIHLAGRAHSKDDGAREKYFNANEDVTRRLIESAIRNGVKRFVYLSSIKVNGESNDPSTPIKVTDIPKPLDYYGASKLAAEECIKRVCAQSETEFVIIRPTLVYGKGVRANFDSLIKLVKTGLPIPLSGLRNKRSMIGVNNLVDLIITASTDPAAKNNIFLASDGDDLSTPEMIDLIAKALDKKARTFALPLALLRIIATVFGRSSDFVKLTGSLTVDLSHTVETLNWQPPFSTAQEVTAAVR